MDTPTPSIETEPSAPTPEPISAPTAETLETALKPRHEAFARAVASGASGASAACIAGYAHDGAATQASRLLGQDDVTARIGEIMGEREAERTEAADRLLDKLEPIYDAAFGAGDFDTAMQSVELQARIMGLVHGGATLRPRRPAGANGADEFDPSARHMEFLDSLEREEDTLAAI